LETFKSFEEVLYQVNEQSFDEIALRLFHFQARNNPIYSQYIHHLGVSVSAVKKPTDIPYLPVSFFKTHNIRTGEWTPQVTFTSSGTTGTVSSRHDVHDIRFYLDHAARNFTWFYGNPDKYSILALLPSYVERGGSSLIAMIEGLIARSPSQTGGFFHQKPGELISRAKSVQTGKVLIWGVAYALMDLAEAGEVDFSECIVMETGGMKGKRRELTRAELHEHLTHSFHVNAIHSEYGMTELMSQAYSDGDGIFRCPPWMKIYLRDPEDPLSVARGMGRGGINIVDLANFRTCAFIETQDLGKITQNGNFEVLGRLDNSDIRGCNLLVE
jgi:phenylacetate-coenzyme A ligase PaaK-like adenylate-forming protein